MARPEILVVDADPRARAALAHGFDRRGFAVAEAACADEALAKALAKRPSLVVSELELPDRDGLALHGELTRAHEGLPFFLLTRTLPRALLDEVLGRGVSDALAKPVQISDLVTLAQLTMGPHPGLLRTELSQLPLPHLLRALVSGGRSGKVILGEEGRIAFRDRRVVRASFRHLEGEGALLRMMTLTAGPADVMLCPVDAEAQLDFDLAALLGRAFPHVRRWEQILAATFPLATKLEVDAERLAAQLPELPDPINGLLKVIDGARSLAEVIDESGLPDLTALEIVGRLDALGLLRPAGTRPRASRESATAPLGDALAAELHLDAPPTTGPAYEKESGSWQKILPEVAYVTDSSLASELRRYEEAHLLRGQSTHDGVRVSVEVFRRPDHEALVQRLEERRTKRRRARIARLALGSVAAIGLALAAGFWLAPVVTPRDRIAETRAHLAAGRMGDALRSAEQATQAQPESPQAAFLAGTLFLRMGDTASALTHLERARTLAPQSAQIVLALGTAYQVSGDVVRARSAYESFLALAPQAPEAADVRMLVEHL